MAVVEVPTAAAVLVVAEDLAVVLQVVGHLQMEDLLYKFQALDMETDIMALTVMVVMLEQVAVLLDLVDVEALVIFIKMAVQELLG
jgi:hypothetical protein